jgi:hypothetical protein
MYQPYPSAGQPAGPPLLPSRAGADRGQLHVRGAAVSTVYLIATLPFIGDIHGTWNGHPLTATPLTITAVIVVFGLVPIALWLWMARAACQHCPVLRRRGGTFFSRVLT